MPSGKSTDAQTNSYTIMKKIRVIIYRINEKGIPFGASLQTYPIHTIENLPCIIVTRTGPRMGVLFKQNSPELWEMFVKGESTDQELVIQWLEHISSVAPLEKYNNVFPIPHLDALDVFAKSIIYE